MAISISLLLEQNEWLAKLSTHARQQIIAISKIKNFHKGQKVHIKGDETDGLYGVLNGEVRISASTYAGDEIILTRLLPGQWFGEIALLDGGQRTHDAYTICDSQLVIVPKKSLLDLCGRMPEVYQALVQLLCQHCRTAFIAMDELLAYTTEQRLARRLLQRIAETGKLEVKVAQQEMGAWVGVSRQSTNKILKSWQTQGIIQCIYRGLEVLDKDKLKVVACV